MLEAVLEVETLKTGSKSRSQNANRTKCLDHWKKDCDVEKSSRRCKGKQNSKWNWQKHHMLGLLLEVERSTKCTLLWFHLWTMRCRFYTALHHASPHYTTIATTTAIIIITLQLQLQLQLQLRLQLQLFTLHYARSHCTPTTSTSSTPNATAAAPTAPTCATTTTQQQYYYNYTYNYIHYNHAYNYIWGTVKISVDYFSKGGSNRVEKMHQTM